MPHQLLCDSGTLTMSKMPSPFEDISAEVKHTADQVVEQALGSMDTYFNYLERTISSSPSGGTEFGEKLKTYAARNIAATHEFIKQLSRAKDFQDVVRIQTKFMQSQLKEFGEQTKSLGEAYTKAAAGAVKAPFKTSPR
jgi:hypothetical protein